MQNTPTSIPMPVDIPVAMQVEIAKILSNKELTSLINKNKHKTKINHLHTCSPQMLIATLRSQFWFRNNFRKTHNPQSLLKIPIYVNANLKVDTRNSRRVFAGLIIIHIS